MKLFYNSASMLTITSLLFINISDVHASRDELRRKYLEKQLSTSGGILGSSSTEVVNKDYVEQIKKAAEQKAKNLEELLQKTKEENEKKLKALQELHNKKIQDEIKRKEEASKALEEALKSQVFQGVDNLKNILDRIDRRIKVLITLNIKDPDEEMRRFIEESQKEYTSFKENIDPLDDSLLPETLLGWQQKLLRYSFGFEEKAIEFIDKRLDQAGVKLPEGFDKLSEVTRQKLLEELALKVQETLAAIEKQQKQDELDKLKLQKELPITVKENLERFTKQIEETPYLKEELEKTSGPNLFKGPLGILKDASVTNLEVLSLDQLKTTSEAVNNAIGELKRGIETLRAAQHPENVSEKMISFANDLYVKFPILSAAKGMPLKKSDNFPQKFSLRFKTLANNIPDFAGLFGTDKFDEALEDYKKFVLKIKEKPDINDKKKLTLVDYILTNFKGDFDKLAAGKLEEDKIYGYYLLLNNMISKDDAENFEFKWQNDPKNLAKALRGYMLHVRMTTLPQKIEKQKASAALSSGLTSETKKKITTEATENIYTRMVNEDLQALWFKDPSLKLLTIDPAMKDTLPKTAPLPGLKVVIDSFLREVYNGYQSTQLGKELNKMPTEGESDETLIAEIKKIIVESLPKIPYEQDLSFPNTPFTSEDYKALFNIISRDLDSKEHLDELEKLQAALEQGLVPNNIELAKALNSILLSAIKSILGSKSELLMDTLSLEKDTLRRFNVPGGEGDGETQQRFKRIEDTMSKARDIYKELVKGYEAKDGKQIFIPTAKLVEYVLLADQKTKEAANDFKLYSQTKIPVNETLVDEILQSFKEFASTMKENTIYKKIYMDVQGKYPKTVLVHNEDLKSFVENTFLLAYGFNIQKLIPTEKQAVGASYTFMKLFLTLKAFSDVVWSNVPPKSVESSSNKSTGNTSSSKGSTSATQKSPESAYTISFTDKRGQVKEDLRSIKSRSEDLAALKEFMKSAKISKNSFIQKAYQSNLKKLKENGIDVTDIEHYTPPLSSSKEAKQKELLKVEQEVVVLKEAVKKAQEVIDSLPRKKGKEHDKEPTTTIDNVVSVDQSTFTKNSESIKKDTESLKKKEEEAKALEIEISKM
jgi:hypothetical protein